ncbi:DUF262 domain-containing protein [Microvenator marinus]|uniref:DUF262 domain-containing protein n=1 Tax=Microvenator marinus TaxID=2600177 RepID=A0A5B8XU69_9DELT|nr:DUF262 domain-containing protein [Microvenator marinus]QED29472.1 DUF262 domain-containing protein [Microvenator marinus]
MTTFLDVVKEGGIRIPLLQRDYAQGREENTQVRESFLDALAEAIRDATGKTLNLDFVYGRRSDGFLEPLDGQQRLTTLFLLHWYLASRNGAQSDFRAVMWDGHHAKFSYLTRPSARDFFDRLVEQPLDISSLSQMDSVQSTIRDQNWFLLAWLRDPTVRGVLTVIDAIHQRLHDLEDGYSRLVNASPIEFQYLPLDEFNLSDDLYIKMNARGKALTPFEIFKVQIEEFVKGCFQGELYPGSAFSWAQYFSLKMDTDWTDIFWKHRVGGSNEVDRQFLNFFKLFGLVSLVDSGRDNTLLAADLTSFLRKPVSLQSLRELGLLDRAFVERLADLLNRLAASGEELSYLGRSDYYDEVADFAEILNTGEGSMSDWVKRYAYFAFLLSQKDRELNPDAFHEWMRLVCNLVHASEIERYDRFANALLAVQTLASYGEGDQLLERVATCEVIGGLNQQQQREERIKASLILTPFQWRPLIEKAETHEYFRGQVEFLMQFSGIYGVWSLDRSWDEKEHKDFQRAFEFWFERAREVFPVEGRFEDFLWERALLCKGDYLLDYKYNKNLLKDSDRDVSWKRLLRADTQTESREAKRDLVKEVLSEFDPREPVGSLQATIQNGVGGADESVLWRKMLVEHPNLIRFCGKRCLRFEDVNIYLLTKTRRSGYHSELATHWLSQEFQRDNEGFQPLQCVYQTSNTGYTEPHAVFSYKTSTLKVLGNWPKVGILIDGPDFPDDMFAVWQPTSNALPVKSPEECRALLLKWAEYLRSQS